MTTNASPDPALPDFLDAKRRTLRPDLAFAEADGDGDMEAWRERLLAEWRRDLPPHEEMPGAHVEGEAVMLRFATGAEAGGRLALPDRNAPCPALLLLHEHGGRFGTGWRKVFDEPESHASRAALYGGAAPAEVFRRAGFAVLSLDAPGFGSRPAGGYEGQQALAAAAMGLGWSLAGLVAAEDVQAARWLSAHPRVDAARVGAFGFSFGGFRAWQVAALSGHVAAAASVGWMACRRDLMAPGMPLLRGHSAFHFLHPGIAHRADFPDLAGLAAGKPLFFRSGRGDKHMPEASVARAWETIAAICAASGGPAPQTGFHAKAHTCPPAVLDAAADFLRNTLR